jgi:hypothetical protein
MHQITKSASEKFRGYVYKCQKVLGIGRIKIRVTEDDLTEDGANAAFQYDYDASNLHISLNSKGIEKTFGSLDEDLAYNAFHETFEGGVLGPVTALVERHISHDEIKELENRIHEIVHSMWAVLREKIL